MTFTQILQKIQDMDLEQARDSSTANQLLQSLESLYKEEGIIDKNGLLVHDKLEEYHKGLMEDRGVNTHHAMSQQTIEKINLLSETLGSTNSKIGLLLGISNIVSETLNTNIAKKNGESIKDIMNKYQTHLSKKMQDNFGDGYTKFKHVVFEEHNPDGLTKYQIKLVNRYVQVTQACDYFSKNGVDAVAVDRAKVAAKDCINQRPDWSERPFLQKLTDFLSLGVKPLYRAFSSKEKPLMKDLENITNPGISPRSLK
jgi:hypothetical protein